MKVTAITKFKHGEIFELLRRLGWSGQELARRCGLCNTAIYNVLNLHRRPTLDTIKRIQQVFNHAGLCVDVLEMFPDYYIGFGKKAPIIEQTRDLTTHQLQHFSHHQQLTLEDTQGPLPDTQTDAHIAMEMLNWSILSQREKRFLVLRFIEDKTLSEIGREMGQEKNSHIPITKDRTRQIIQVALAKIRRRLRT